jgi:hypothetical protein
VDAEHPGGDGGGQVGGELEQRDGAGLRGRMPLAEPFTHAEGADGPSGLAAGEQPGRGAEREPDAADHRACVIGITDAGSALIDSVRRDNASRLPECITRLHPADLAFLATINRVPTTALGVTRFGQSGSLENVYRHHGIDADSIIRAALDLTT